MRRVSPLAVGAWVVATATATVVSWAGVGAVTRAVAGSPDQVIPTGRLDAAPPAAVPPAGAPGTVPTPISGAARIVPNATPTSIAPGPARGSTGTTVPPASTPSHEPVPARPGGDGGGSEGTWPTSPPTSAPLTFPSPGGQATVSCRADSISLLSALPANGFAVSVQSGGPEQVAVSFSGDGLVYQVGALCRDGAPVRTESGVGVTATTTTTAPGAPGGGHGGQPGGGGGEGGPPSGGGRP